MPQADAGTGLRLLWPCPPRLDMALDIVVMHLAYCQIGGLISAGSGRVVAVDSELG